VQTAGLVAVSALVGGAESVLIVGEAPIALAAHLEELGCKVRSVGLTTERPVGADVLGADRVSGPGRLPADVAWDSFSVVVVCALERLPDAGAVLRELSVAPGSGCRLVATFRNAAFAGTRLSLLSGALPTPDGPTGLTRAAAEELLALAGWDVLHTEAISDNNAASAAVGVPASVADWVAAASDAGVAEYVVLCQTHREVVGGVTELVRRLSGERDRVEAEAARLRAEQAATGARFAARTAAEAELRRQLDQVAETATEAELEVLELEDKLYQRDHALASARQQLAEAANRLHAYQDDIDRLQAEAANRLHAYQDDIDRLQDGQRAMARRLEEYVDEVERREQELIHRRKAHAELSDRLGRSEPLAARAEAAEAELAAVLASRSWRWARRAAALVSGLRGR
jgi:hypothetical protein